MNRSLKQVFLTREARREAALAKLSAARSQCDLAYARCHQVYAELEQARQWRADVLARCALGEGQSIRESVLPACEALLQQRQQMFALRQTELRMATDLVATERRELLACERDLLRLQEWQTLEQNSACKEQAMQENRFEEDQVFLGSVRDRAA